VVDIGTCVSGSDLRVCCTYGLVLSSLISSRLISLSDACFFYRMHAFPIGCMLSLVFISLSDACFPL
jgi:hypothetical protein